MLTRSGRASLALAASIALPSAGHSLENGLLIDGALPEYREMALSPGGSHLAGLYASREGTGINVLDLRSKASQRIALPAKDGEITGMIWKGDGRVLFVVDQPAGDTLLLSSDRAGNDMRILANGIANLHEQVLSWLPEDPQAVLVGGLEYDTRVRSSPPMFEYERNWSHPTRTLTLVETELHSPTVRAVRLDAVTGEKLPAPAGADLESAVAILADTGGQLRFAVQKDGQSRHTLLSWHAEPGQWFPLLEMGDDPSLRLVALDERNDPLVLTTGGRDVVGVNRFDLGSARPGERLLETAGADIAGPWRNPADGDVIAYRYVTDRQLLVPAIEPARRLAAQLAQRHPHDDVAIVSFDSAKRLAIGKVTHAWGTADFELMAVATGLSSSLTAPHRGPLPQRMLRTRVPGKGGIEIPATLVLPDDADGSLPPLVVRPLSPLTSARLYARDHGMQWLVGRGYAVLNVITRGARGMGTRLREAGRGAFAREGLDDVTAAVQWARASGKIDAQRIAVQGELFDADLALLAASRPGQPFRCVVAVRPLADLEKYSEYMVKWAPRVSRDNWEFLFGDLGGRMTRSQSPQEHASELAAPVFVAHWDDSRAEKYVNALRRFDKPVTAVQMDAPTTGQSRVMLVTEAFAEAESFLAECLAGRTEASGS